jgi:hypothetical protein
MIPWHIHTFLYYSKWIRNEKYMGIEKYGEVGALEFGPCDNSEGPYSKSQGP